MDFVKYRNIFFIISALVLLPGMISLLLNGLKLGIDFTGGTLIELRSPNFRPDKKEELINEIKNQKIEISSIQQSADNAFLIRAKAISQEKNEELIQALKKKYEKIDQVRFESVGPTVGAELTRNAIIALCVASLVIVFYIAWTFRSIPKPASSWRFGLTAIAALLHDAFAVIGAFSIFGWLWDVEIDALFVTALLTIIGFSVHDTIVVYDRIRENLIKGKAKTFAETVNISIWETLARSINTSTTVILVLLAIILFGGETIRWFAMALLIGIISGTYSSICNAAQLLVVWEEKTAPKRQVKKEKEK